MAIVDGYARRVLAWRIANTLAAGFGVDGLEEARRAHGRPEVFNTDPGSPFTRQAVTGVCLLYTSPSPRDRTRSRMPSSA